MVLVEAFYEILKDDYAANLRDIMLNFPNPTFLNLFKEVVLKWGQSTPNQQIANHNSILEPWHLNDSVIKLWC